MTDYDPAYDPPAPVATVVLRNITSGATVPDVLLLLDTGADVTLLPRAAIEALGVAIVSGLTYDLVGFDGSRTTAHAADLDMIFLKKSISRTISPHPRRSGCTRSRCSGKCGHYPGWAAAGMVGIHCAPQA